MDQQGNFNHSANKVEGININPVDTNIISKNSGEVIFKTDDPEEGIYFLQKGLLVLSDSSKKDRILYPGQLAGLYHPQKKKQRSNTLVAITQSRILYYSHEEYLHLWHKVPSLFQNLIKTELLSKSDPEYHFLDEQAVQTLYSTLKMIFWASKDALEQPISINQMSSALSALRVDDEQYINYFINILNDFKIVRRISEKSILLKKPDVIQILLEFIQDILLIKNINPWQLIDNQSKIISLIQTLSSTKNEIRFKKIHLISLMKKLLGIHPEVGEKILILWKSKKILEFDSNEIFITSVTSKLEILSSTLEDYNQYKILLFALLTAITPEFNPNL